jgi:hypothetical protein
MNVTRIIWSLVGAVIALCSVLLILFCTYKVISSPKQITHCYIDHMPAFDNSLYGNVEWGLDIKLGMYPSTELALEAAQKMNCNVTVKP